MATWKSIVLLSFVSIGLAHLSPSVLHAQFAGYMPEESAPHEGTWLQWPHHYTYGTRFRNEVESSWVEMTRILVQSENVHILVYNANERRRIRSKLINNRVPLQKVNFVTKRTDDFWVRDNGPIFIHDLGGRGLAITDWRFNGWGWDAPFANDNTVPFAVGRATGIRRYNNNDMVLEGGAIEVDGNGVLMATKSSILEPNRNPGWTQTDVEEYLAEMLGISKFIWLDGRPGGNEDITDTHIDGFARFGLPDTIVTMNRRDLRYWGLSDKDIGRLFNARDLTGKKYKLVRLPLTRFDVRTTYGYNIGIKGSYVNFYVSNRHVLMPTYGDPNDEIAKSRLQLAFPNRQVVGIDFRNAYRYGGMIHCVTQQQPQE